jgi:hypothetical protein
MAERQQQKERQKREAILLAWNIFEIAVAVSAESKHLFFLSNFLMQC